MDEKLRAGYEKQHEHLWANAYKDDGTRPFSTKETKKYLDKTANGKAGGHTKGKVPKRELYKTDRQWTLQGGLGAGNN